MQYKLQEFFDSIEDPRRGQGQRHKFHQVLIIVIMAIFSGYQGLNGFARFAKANEDELTQLLDLNYGVPCYFTFRAILTQLEEQILVNSFINWAKTYLPDLANEFIALDDEVTTSGGNTKLQNFVAVVNTFGHHSSMVSDLKYYENGKSGKSQILRDLVKQLGLTDKVFTMNVL